MTDEPLDVGNSAPPSGAVVAAVVPGQSPRVLREAALFARRAGAALIVAHVDTTRFVAFEDPDGYVHATSVDVAGAAARAALAEVEHLASTVLGDAGVPWTIQQLIGDPALALIQLADRVGAEVLVVGTRKRGLGESIREFLTGSVAARLTHRQHRPVLVVPLGEPLAADEELVWD